MLETGERIIRKYDIRGKVPGELDTEKAREIGGFLGSKYKRVVLSNDLRKTSPALAYAFISGFLESGGDVLFQGEASFGTALYAGYLEKTDLTAYITASHLPGEYNGIKLYTGDGLGLSPQEVLQSCKSEKRPWKEFGVVERIDRSKDYINFFSERYSFSGRIAVDCGGGATSLIAKRLFEGVGLEVKPVFCNPDPALVSRNPEPKPEYLTKLKKEARGMLGIAFDGDGDRVVFFDENGRYVTPEQIAILIARNALEENGRALVVANTECSSVLENYLGEGVDVKRIPVGHTSLTYFARKLGADIGVEASGHFIIPGILPFDDSVPVVMEVLRIKGERRLSELVSDIPIYPKERLDIGVPDEKKFELVSRFKEIALERYEKVTTVDGVRVDLPDGWVLVRASNTEPKVRMTVEAVNEDELKRILGEFRNILEGLI